MITLDYGVTIDYGITLTSVIITPEFRLTSAVITLDWGRGNTN